MIISHKYKIIFIHIPKNAGSFITFILKLVDPNLEKIHNAYGGHQTFSECYDIIKQYPGYTTFCVLRNVYDINVSLFHYIKNTNCHFLYETIKDMSFREFIEYSKEFIPMYNQVDYIFHSDGDICIDKILFFDNISSQFYSFLKEVGLDDETLDKLNLEGKINQSEHQDYREYYDDYTREIVKSIYQRDFEYFNNPIYEHLIKF